MEQDKYREFVEMVANSTFGNPAALAAKARRLLGLPPLEIDIRDIRNSLLMTEYNNINSVEAARMVEGYLIEHGGVVLEMLLDGISEETRRDDIERYAELANELCHIKDDATKDARREFTEKLLLHPNMYAGTGDVLYALEQYDDPRSIPVIQKWLDSGRGDKFYREYAKSLIATAKKVTTDDIPF